MNLQGSSDILKSHFLKPFLLKQTCNPFNNCSPYFKIYRQIWVLMRNIYSCAYDEVNLIAFHDQPYDLICRAFAKLYTCLLYTSDAADDLTRVDLGGRCV